MLLICYIINKETEVKMRQTKQKRYIMEAFQNYHGHPTAEELYAVLSPKHPRLSLAQFIVI